MKRKPKKPEDIEKDTQLILEEYGILSSDSASIVKRINEAKKGSEVDNKKIKIKPYEQGKKKNVKKKSGGEVINI